MEPTIQWNIIKEYGNKNNTEEQLNKWIDEGTWA